MIYPNTADSKINNIVLVRGMYKRDTPVSVYREIFVYRSSSRNFFELGSVIEKL